MGPDDPARPLHRIAVALPLIAALVPGMASAATVTAADAATSATPAASASATRADWPLEPAPDWVVPVAPFGTAFDEPADPGDDIDYRLFDRQVDLRRPGTPVDWRAVEREFLSRDGVYDGSGLKITFDPEYERVRLHELEILRGGRREDRRDSARIDLLHREPDLEAATFDGRRTLSILLADVRVGDVLRASWSVEGTNPVFDGHYESSFQTTMDRSRQQRRRLRVLSPADRPLRVRGTGNDAGLVRTVDDVVETTTLDLAGLVPRRPDGDEPDGPPGLIVFGTVADWADVVALEAPFYDARAQRSPELADVASRIRADHPDVPGRTGAALRWVQEEIRYFGMQLGQHSHRPAPVSETLARRFGDCKGKALLLMTLLDELGIESRPALVDTGGLRDDTDGDGDGGQPWRLHAFDHVVVTLVVDGERHFIDPTRDDQRGPLGRFHEPDYGSALVLAPGTTRLVSMSGAHSGWYEDVLNAFVVPADRDAPTAYTVTTVRRGVQAEKARRALRRDGARARSEDWLEYYGELWPGIVATAPVEVDEAADGTLTIVEHYMVPDFWRGGETPVVLTPDTLSSAWLELPDADENRPGRPTSLSWPAEVVERWRVTLPEPMRLTGLGDEIDTPWYRVEETSSFDSTSNVLEVVQRYGGRTARVPAESRDDFEAPRDEMDELLAFSIEDARPLPDWLRSTLDVVDEVMDEAVNESAEPVTPTRLETVESWAVVLGLPCFAAWGGMRHRRHRRERGRIGRSVSGVDA